MNVETREAVAAVLCAIVDPCSIATGVPINLIDMGLLRPIDERDGSIFVILRLTGPRCWQVASILAEIERKLSALQGAGSAVCTVDAAAQWEPDFMAPEARRRLRERRPLPIPT